VLCKDLENQLDVVQSIAPKVYATGDSPVDGTALDRASGGYASILVVFTVGAIVSAGLFTPSVEDSADGVTYAPTSKVTTALVNLVAATQQRTSYTGSKRYVRAVGTYVSGTSTAFSATLIGARGNLS
jgi:hypothetical protein